MAKVFGAWGIELDDYDRRFLVGIGYSSHLSGEAADWTQPITTLMFKTRGKAREALSRYKAASAWAFAGKSIREGGNRIYRSGRVVYLKIKIDVQP